MFARTVVVRVLLVGVVRAPNDRRSFLFLGFGLSGVSYGLPGISDSVGRAGLTFRFYEVAGLFVLIRSLAMGALDFFPVACLQQWFVRRRGFVRLAPCAVLLVGCEWFRNHRLSNSLEFEGFCLLRENSVNGIGL